MSKCVYCREEHKFAADIFEEITGIDVRKEEEMIDIDGKKWSKSTIKEVLRRHAE